MKPAEAARLLNVSERTLEAWRYKGMGPKFLRISARCIRYRPQDILDWQENRLRRSTSENL